MRGGGRGTAGGGEWRGHAGGGGWQLLSSALVRGDGSQKNRSSRLACRGRLAALSVAIECSEALPVRTLVDLIYFPHVGQERSDIVFLSLSLSLSLLILILMERNLAMPIIFTSFFGLIDCGWWI